MKKIDNDLGGTTPLNIILKFPKKEQSNQSDDDDFSEWEEDNVENEDKSKIYGWNKIR